MNQIDPQIAQYLTGMIHTSLDLQKQRIKDHWEVGLVHYLGGLAGEAFRVIKSMLAELDQATTPAPGLTSIMPGIQNRLARMTAKHIEVTKSLLQDLVETEAQELGQALTVNGLAADIPTLAAAYKKPEAAMAELACGQVIDESITSGYVWFMQRVMDVLQRAEQSGLGHGQALTQLEVVCRQWRGQLDRIARTTTHAAFNRTKLAMSQQLH